MKSCPSVKVLESVSWREISRSEILRKQEHKVSYRCSLPSPLQKRSKDWEDLKVLSFWIFLDWSQEVSQISEKLLSKVKENLQNFHAIFCNPWISSAMAMAMSINRTLCVLVSTQAPPVVPVINIGYALSSGFFHLSSEIWKLCRESRKFHFFRGTL